MDKIFLIGHRGVGKTTLVSLFQKKHPHYQCLDLDEVIESDYNRTIQDYFDKNEEELFRKNELNSLHRIFKERGPYLVAIGAGCELQDVVFPTDSVVLWVRRTTDSTGRIFLGDRPALTNLNDPLLEWQSKFNVRESLYEQVARAQVFLPEEVEPKTDHLSRYLFDKISMAENFYCTLLPKENLIPCMANSFGIELRNDIWSELDIHKILKQVPFQRRIILAIRKINTLTMDFLKNFDRHKYPNLKIDWDITLAQEVGDLPSFKPGDIISEHRNGLKDLLIWKNTHKNIFVYKYAPEFNLLEDALSEFEIVKKEFNYFAFFPRSSSMDLSWLRMMLSDYNEFNFFKFSSGSAKEQAYWFDLGLHKPMGFYGILGENVQHSLTPDVHRELFVDKAVYPVRISIPHSQLNPSVFDFMKQYGLRALAVTSPFKHQVYNWFKDTFLDDDLKGFESANTIAYGRNFISTTNTDYIGLKKFFETHLDLEKPIVVFGGGSLLPQIKSLIPAAFFISARTGALRDDQVQRKVEFAQLESAQWVWAAGDIGELPTVDHEIDMILDLDYRSNSKAKKWAYQLSKENKKRPLYIGGLDFFKIQAKQQQTFWKNNDV